MSEQVPDLCICFQRTILSYIKLAINQYICNALYGSFFCMEKLNVHTITDILYDLVFTHLDRFRELRDDINNPDYCHLQKELKDRLSAEIELYNLDILEVYEVANKVLDEEQFDEIANSIRNQFNIYILDIFTNNPTYHE
jgi:hypothetical protein